LFQQEIQAACHGKVTWYRGDGTRSSAGDTPREVRTFKLLAVGDSGVGKSSFLQRFADQTWSAN
jgi:GTPase SAR1 family protein